MDLTTALALTAEQLLAVSVAEALFEESDAAVKSTYRRLASRWHPDHGGRADVFAHVKLLYEQALEKLALGTWQVPGVHRIITTGGKEFKLRYRKHRPFLLGDMYIGDTLVAYAIDHANKDLLQGLSTKLKFTYATKAMETEVSRFLPKVEHQVSSSTHDYVIIAKTPDLICLADVLEHFKGRLDSRHVAWVVSRLLNISCYLKYAGLVHGDISPETFFVSPQYHSGALLGGWWYAHKVDQRLVALPERTIDVMDQKLLSSKRAAFSIDQDLIKRVGRELLGDPLGTKLLSDPQVKRPMATWLRTPGGTDAVREYKTWYDNILLNSFGARKFVELKLTADDVYGSL